MFSRESKDWHFQCGNGFNRLLGNSIADFDLFWPKCASVFLWGNFQFCGETVATFRDQSAMLGEHLSQKI